MKLFAIVYKTNILAGEPQNVVITKSIKVIRYPIPDIEHLDKHFFFYLILARVHRAFCSKGLLNDVKQVKFLYAHVLLMIFARITVDSGINPNSPYSIM